MKLLIGGIVLFAVGALSLEENHQIDQIQDNVEMLETALLGANELQQLSYYAESIADALRGKSDSDTLLAVSPRVDTLPWSKECMECTCRAAYVDLEIAFEFVKGMCEQHPQAHGGWWYICHWVKRQPEEVKGYIESKMHALLTGFSYCCGKGDCSISHLPEQSPAVGMMAMNQCSAVSRTEDVSDVAEERREAIANHIHSLLESIQQSHGKSPHHNRPTKECRHCLKITMRHVIRMAEAKACRVCREHEECPPVHAVCKFMKEHPHFAKGWIIGMVEPWKFSMGFCLGKGVCNFGMDTGCSGSDCDDNEDELHDFLQPHPNHHHHHAFFDRHPMQPPIQWENIKAAEAAVNVDAVEALMEFVQ